MPLTPKFKHINEKKFAGLRVTMSLTDNKTFELWNRFMSRRNEIKNTVGPNLVSLRTYPRQHFDNFNPHALFTKWALVEVNDWDDLPEDFEKFVLPSGDYAVFRHRGFSSDTSIFQYIYGVWIPESEFNLAERPHFEILGPNYKNDHPLSEEEIWIPIEKVTDDKTLRWSDRSEPVLS